MRISPELATELGMLAMPMCGPLARAAGYLSCMRVSSLITQSRSSIQDLAGRVAAGGGYDAKAAESVHGETQDWAARLVQVGT